MITKVRFPDLLNSDDPKIRQWASELVRSLTEYSRESIFQDIVAIVTAGNNIILSVESLPEKIYINAISSGGGSGLTSTEVCAMLSAYLTSTEASDQYLTTSEGDDRYITTAELSAHDYVTSQEVSALIAGISGGGGGLNSAQVCGMLSGYITSNDASTTYLTKTSSSAFIKDAEVSTLVCGMLSAYLTSQGASSTYQPIGSYLTSSLTTAQACALIESYGYASVNLVSSTYLTKASSSAFLKSAEVCAMLCVALSGYLTSQDASSKFLISSITTAQTCALVEAYNYMVSVCNVSAGTYGTSTIIPQITVDESGRITEIVRVTAPSGVGGGLTSTEVCAMLSAYITSNDASATYLTKASSSAFLKSADVCAMICAMTKLVYTYTVTVTTEKTNSTETTVPGWSLQLPAGGIYNFEWRSWLFAASVPDVKFNLGKSDTGTTGRFTNQNTALAANTVTSVNTALAIVIPGSTFYQTDHVGYLITGASTTNAWITFAQNTSTGGTPVKLLPGSTLTVWKN